MPNTLTDHERETLDQARKLADADPWEVDVREVQRLLTELATLVYLKAR